METQLTNTGEDTPYLFDDVAGIPVICSMFRYSMCGAKRYQATQIFYVIVFRHRLRMTT